jgi:hypothetical protein
VSAPLFNSTASPPENLSPSPSTHSQPVRRSNPKIGPGSHNNTVQKLERVATRLREIDGPCFSLANLNTALNECLNVSGPLSEAGVLPASQKVAPNI